MSSTYQMFPWACQTIFPFDDYIWRKPTLVIYLGTKYIQRQAEEKRRRRRIQAKEKRRRRQAEEKRKQAEEKRRQAEEKRRQEEEKRRQEEKRLSEAPIIRRRRIVELIKEENYALKRIAELEEQKQGFLRQIDTINYKKKKLRDATDHEIVLEEEWKKTQEEWEKTHKTWAQLPILSKEPVKTAKKVEECRQS
jgi:hypothetical protein